MDIRNSSSYRSEYNDYYMGSDGNPVYSVGIDEVDHLFVSSQEAAIVTIAMPIVFIIGCLGNVLTIFVILRVKEMRTVTNYFLINLATSDLLFLIMVVPPKFLGYVIPNVPLIDDWTLLGAAGCKIFSYGPRMATSVSCFIILTLTIERYLAICWPLKFRTIRTRKKAVVVAGIIWVAAAVVSTPHAYFPAVQKWHLRWPSPYNSTAPDVLTQCYCYTNDSSNSPDVCYYYVLFGKIDEIMFLCFVPVLVILYVLMLLKLRHANRFVRAAQVRNSNSIAAKRQLIRMLGVTVTVYLICVGSFRVMALLMLFNPGYQKHILVLQTVRVLLYVNAAVNPVIYNVFSQTFRTAFIRVLSCQGNRINPENESSSDNVALTTTNDDSYRKRSVKRMSSRPRPSKPSLKSSTRHANGSFSQPNGSCRHSHRGYRLANGSERRQSSNRR
ncbi:allatostatin-A receptor-like [Ptychodera flava]|uniref:allatostatin-A receptor-like n=1 Tax=Ptychodera flava TaxID=63121 RepID=UPI00396A8CB3